MKYWAKQGRQRAGYGGPPTIGLIVLCAALMSGCQFMDAVNAERTVADVTIRLNTPDRTIPALGERRAVHAELLTRWQSQRVRVRFAAQAGQLSTTTADLALKPLSDNDGLGGVVSVPAHTKQTLTVWYTPNEGTTEDTVVLVVSDPDDGEVVGRATLRFVDDVQPFTRPGATPVDAGSSAADGLAGADSDGGTQDTTTSPNTGDADSGN